MARRGGGWLVVALVAGVALAGCRGDGGAAPTATTLPAAVLAFCDGWAADRGTDAHRFATTPHVAEVRELAAAAPEAVRAEVEGYAAFVASDAVDNADPGTTHVVGWPVEQQIAVGRIAAWHATHCPAPGEPGVEATWTTDPAHPPAPGSATFTAWVTRRGCNGGTTGTVLAPRVEAGPEEVVITFTVTKLPDRPRTCPGNAPTPFQVDLGEPLGDRVLLGGAA